MPWTFAHPAAILPLRSLCPRWLSLPALVLGAIGPDLGYHFALFDWASFCHTPLGIVSGCLPQGLVLLALLTRWHRLLTVLLPAPHRQLFRTQLQPAAHAAPWLAVAVWSLLLGAATHVIWDAFTHAGRWGVLLLPGLNEPLFSAVGRQFRVFNLLQHLSTAVGLAALALAYRRCLCRQPPPPSSTHEGQRKQLLLAGLAGAAVAGAGMAWALTPIGQPGSLSHLVVRTVICSTSGFALFFVLGSLAWWQHRGDDA